MQTLKQKNLARMIPAMWQCAKQGQAFKVLPNGAIQKIYTTQGTPTPKGLVNCEKVLIAHKEGRVCYNLRGSKNK